MDTIRLAYVLWEDAYSKYGRMEREDIESLGPCLMHSGGIIIEEDDNKVVICMDYSDGDGIDDDESIRDILVVPKAYIRKIHRWDVATL